MFYSEHFLITLFTFFAYTLGVDKMNLTEQLIKDAKTYFGLALSEQSSE